MHDLMFNLLIYVLKIYNAIKEIIYKKSTRKLYKLERKKAKIPESQSFKVYSFKMFFCEM